MLDFLIDLWYNAGPLRGRHHFCTSLLHFGAERLRKFYITFALRRWEHFFHITLALWRGARATVAVCWFGGVVVCWCSNTPRQVHLYLFSHLRMILIRI